MARTYDPLSYIPSPDVVRRRLNEIESEAAGLRVLLKTAEEIAQAKASTARRLSHPTPPSQGASK